MIVEIAPVGGLVWWCVVAIASLFIILAVVNRALKGAIFVLLLALGVLILVGDTWAYLKAFLTPWRLIPGLVFYVLAGAFWGFCRWVLYAWERRRKYRGYQRKWLRDQGVDADEVPEELKAKWQETLLNSYGWYRVVPNGEGGTKRIVSVNPIIWEHKSDLVCWMAFWPWSAAWEIIDAIGRWIWEYLFDFLARLYQGVIDWLFPEPFPDE